MNDQVVILAGGVGTRMLPRTENIPKILLPVAGRPFAAWLLERLSGAGFREALICVAHFGDQVRDAIGDGRAHGLSVRYSDDGHKLLGTAGALRRALDALEPTFVVTYGDSLLPFNYKAPLDDLRAHPEASGTMTVYRNQGRFDASNTEVRGEMVVRYEKRPKGAAPDPALDWIDYGAVALRREVIAALPAHTFLGLEAIQQGLASAGALRALPVEKRFFEIGSPQGLLDLEAALLDPLTLKDSP